MKTKRIKYLLTQLAKRPRITTGESRSSARTEVGGSQGDQEVKWLRVVGARQNNLKDITVEIPLQRFVAVTGVSGSGKSSLVNDILREALARDLNGAEDVTPGAHERIEGLEHLDKVIDIDQSPIGRTPRSNPATYIKVFDQIRDLYTRLPDAKVRGYKPGRFSFNVSTGEKGGGRCEACEGNGSNKMEMELLADVWVTCPVCSGRRFSRETLQILYKGKSIADVLEMDVQEALAHFEHVPKIASMLQTLHDVGLDYMKLGQSSTTLSGGEAQRIKLARELVKKSTGRTLYLLDEPTTGLHFADIKRLLAVLHGFVDAGNTVVVIEHNLDVIKTADWIIDLGPEGGAAGGEIVACGTPEEVAGCGQSYTGLALRQILKGRGELRITNYELQFSSPQSTIDNRQSPIPSTAKLPDYPITKSIKVVGARQHNLKDISVEVPRDKITVCSGPSGSGKSSFAIDTVYTEGQRRYVESLSSYARQFLGRLQPPKVDHVYGLSPAICIEQKNTSRSPRSTVGTVTEIYDYMRVLWTRIGQPHCPKCKVPIGTQTSDEIVDRILCLDEGTKLLLLAPVEPGAQETYSALLQRERANGYARARIDGALHALDEPIKLDPKGKHQVELVVDRIIVRASQRRRICDSVEQALAVGQGVMLVALHEEDDRNRDRKEATNEELRITNYELQGRRKRRTRSPREDRPADQSTADNRQSTISQLPNYQIAKLPDFGIRFSQHHSCSQCGAGYEELTPHHFSFNTRMGWCETCEGLGIQQGAAPSAIVTRPTRSIVDGAILGWGEVAPGSLLHALASAVAEHIGFDVPTPWDKLTEPQQLQFLQGCGDDWIDVETSKRQNVKTSKQTGGAMKRQSDEKATGKGEEFHHLTTSLRVQWRGFFPAIDRATRINNEYRDRLADMVTDIPCEACGGGRLKPEPSAVRLADRTIRDICSMPLGKALNWFEKLKLDARQKRIAGELLHEITSRLRFLVDVGLDYITLHRRAATLSGGEAQRIQLASQIGTGLTGVLYVLDEPTIGLHPRDNSRLIGALQRLRDLGNTLLLVEHDREVIDSADHVLDFGPGAGIFGGTVTAAASPAKLRSARNSLTGKYLSAKEAIAVPSNRRAVEERDQGNSSDEATKRRSDGEKKSKSRKVEQSKRVDHDSKVVNWLTVCGARENNLKEIDVAFPLGRFTCVTGVSGSGKSTLVSDILCNALMARLHRARVVPGGHASINGIVHVDKVINVDQSPIGNSPMSNPATYTGAFDAIREVFAKLPLSKIRGYTANRFSFNRPGGRCEACEGMGQRCIEMHFLPDVWIDCENCKGARYVPETLGVAFRGKSIADVLNMRISEAAELFDSIPKVRRILRTLDDVGLGYLQLGQSAPTLSGGEAQRVKLAAELGKPSTGKTLYVLDEPTTGLHFDDLRKLLGVLHRLVDLGNTVICIEHNLDVIKTADWVIDLGPEAGECGGEIVAAGPPELIAATPQSHTGRALKPVLELGPVAERPVFDAKKSALRDLAQEKRRIDLGGEVKMPWEVDGQRWHTVDHLDHNGEAVQWEPALLTWLVDAIHSARDRGIKGSTDRDRTKATKRRSEEATKGTQEVEKSKSGFTPTDWNHRSRVEITAGRNEQWFCHLLTGNKDLLEVAIRVPRRTFGESQLQSLLRIKTLDEREDLPIYGQWDRVRVRQLKGIAGDWDDIRLSLRDMKDIDRRGFASFLEGATEAYFGHIARQAESPELSEPWKVDGQQWHLSHKGMSARQKPRWSSALLLALIGRLKSLEPDLQFDWSSSKTGVNIFAGDGSRRGKIVTNMGRGLRVCLLVPAGIFTPAQVDRLGEEVEIKPCRESDWIIFWLKNLSDNDSAQLREVWTRALEGPERETEEVLFA